MNPTVIALVGLMGSGKSTLGRRLAERLHIPFVDLDEMIIQRAGKSIPDIFAQNGEVAFRTLEFTCLQDVCALGERHVLATGGGVVLSARNRLLLAKHTVIWLDAPVKVLAERVSNDSNRPLLHDCDALQRMRELDRQRRTLYDALADFHVNTHQCDVIQAVDTLCEKLAEC